MKGGVEVTLKPGAKKRTLEPNSGIVTGSLAHYALSYIHNYQTNVGLPHSIQVLLPLMCTYCTILRSFPPHISLYFAAQLTLHTHKHTQFLDWWTPILAVACVGVAVGVAFLVAGCVVCGCRCCGNCGGGYSMKQSHDRTMFSCTLLLLLFTLALL